MIELSKTYRTRNKLAVVVLDVNYRYRNDARVIGKLIFANGQEELWVWHACGTDARGFGPDYDLIEIAPYTEWPVDAACWVADDDQYWYKRNFAGVDDHGLPTVWAKGTNSWTGVRSELDCQVPELETWQVVKLAADFDPAAAPDHVYGN